MEVDLDPSKGFATVEEVFEEACAVHRALQEFKLKNEINAEKFSEEEIEQAMQRFYEKMKTRHKGLFESYPFAMQYMIYLDQWIPAAFRRHLCYVRDRFHKAEGNLTQEMFEANQLQYIQEYHRRIKTPKRKIKKIVKETKAKMDEQKAWMKEVAESAKEEFEESEKEVAVARRRTLAEYFARQQQCVAILREKLAELAPGEFAEEQALGVANAILNKTRLIYVDDIRENAEELLRAELAERGAFKPAEA